MLKKYLKYTTVGLGVVALLIATYEVYLAEASTRHWGGAYLILLPFMPLIENRFPVIFLPSVIVFSAFLAIGSFRSKYLPAYLAAFTAGVVQLVLYFYVFPNSDGLVWWVITLPVAICEAIAILLLIALSRLLGRFRRRAA